MYLRLSITDACDFRCWYCRPERCSGEASRRDALLPLEELSQLVQAVNRAAPLSKVRITGGEPLMRKKLPSLVEGLRAALPTTELAMTTNGARLREQARTLREAGLDRINISLDSIDGASFARVTGTNELDAVLDGIAAARRAGFSPIKLNAVLLRSGAAQELESLVRFAAKAGAELRFIELMAIGPAAARHEHEYVGAEEALELLRAAGGDLGRLPNTGTAERHLFEREGREVVVGFINSVSHPFCSRCDRLRLDARGGLRSCLRRDDVVDLAGLLPSGAARVADAVRAVIETKREPGPHWPDLPMADIGG